ncbi:uncharacterized protein AMSG_01017 [Thecamonas trahens ATCC 50062]|uniref:Tetratricopeptide SHNi-TPR domain-containing protein n=1 Tax=Thecamonas trahens ATCC 50062 TaxID=461836 RepID=A0A0L0DJE8_THETB|nr:hypothetical protein AMSG_01017 [Thecamonas trahens ATCC 50062]KNC52191.1 hypothetical protein AMSG_01017 [Thecamonas trahens ATCC 50062]|eukprot:XP_013762194.1 hypothetical protein AMSG_01017 [Thecamonas trahens ATCC 50062]
MQVQAAGEQHPSTAPFYVAYGKALLDCARAKGNVLSGMSGAGAGAGGDDGDDADDLTIAWEVLELARVIYSSAAAAGDAEAAQRQAEVHCTIGEVCLESDNMDGAIKEYTAAAEIYSKTLPQTDGAVAEVYYLLGTSQQLGGHHTDAEASFTKAADAVAAAISDYETRAKTASPEDAAKLSSKIADRRGILAEISDKIAETKALASEMELLAKAKAEAKAKAATTSAAVASGRAGFKNATIDFAPPPSRRLSSTASSASSASTNAFGKPSAASTAPVNDLSSLVKRKPAAKPAAGAPVNDLSSLVKRKAKPSAPQAASPPVGSKRPANAAPEDQPKAKK